MITQVIAVLSLLLLFALGVWALIHAKAIRDVYLQDVPNWMPFRSWISPETYVAFNVIVGTLSILASLYGVWLILLLW